MPVTPLSYSSVSTNHAPPLCQYCNTSMQFMYSIPRLGGLPELRAFVCQGCRAVEVEEIEVKGSKRTPDRATD
jgi:hypothetical protein